MPDRIKILVVDDDPYLLDLLTETLDALAYEPKSAPGAVQALEIMAREQIDLVITDIKMPGMDGVEFAKTIKREHPQMPVIFITGVYPDRLESESRASGILAKPFRINQVEELIEKALADRDLPVGGDRVLVVDDDDSFRIMLVEALKLSGYEVEAAENAEEALRKMNSGGISTVIADIKMPGTDGLTLTRTIKRNWPEIPVVLITGYVPYDEISEIADLTDGILEKPFRIDSITGVLEKIRKPSK